MNNLNRLNTIDTTVIQSNQKSFSNFFLIVVMMNIKNDYFKFKKFELLFILVRNQISYINFISILSNQLYLHVCP